MIGCIFIMSMFDSWFFFTGSSENVSTSMMGKDIALVYLHNVIYPVKGIWSTKTPNTHHNVAKDK